MSLERDQGDVVDLRLGLAQELLAGRQKHVLVLSLDLNLCDTRDRDGHALAGVHAGALHLQGHRVQGDPERFEKVLDWEIYLQHVKKRITYL